MATLKLIESDRRLGLHLYDLLCGKHKVGSALLERGPRGSYLIFSPGHVTEIRGRQALRRAKRTAAKLASGIRCGR